MSCPGDQKARTKLKSFLIEIGGIFRCVNCDLPLKSQYDLFDHFKDAHSELCCDNCGLFFANDDKFRNHLHDTREDCSCADCSSRMVAGNEEIRQNKIRRDELLAGEQSCPGCNKIFGVRQFLEHMRRPKCKVSSHTRKDFEEAFHDYIKSCPGELFTFAYRPDGSLRCSSCRAKLLSPSSAVQHLLLRSRRCLGTEATTDFVHFLANNPIGADTKSSRFVCLHTTVEAKPTVKDVKHGQKLGGSMVWMSNR